MAPPKDPARRELRHTTIIDPASSSPARHTSDEEETVPIRTIPSGSTQVPTSTTLEQIMVLMQQQQQQMQQERQQEQQRNQQERLELLNRIDRLQTTVQQGVKRITTNGELAKWTQTELQSIEAEFNSEAATLGTHIQALRVKYDILADRLNAGATIAEANEATTLLTSDERLANTFATALKKTPSSYVHRSPPRTRSTRQAMTCSKCGRKNHRASNCFAKIHIDGSVIKSE
jgi:hypothetical protein